MVSPILDILLYVVIPLWMLAGFADYLCHRANDIEHTSGVQESLLHWLLLGEMGVPLIAATFLKINALMLGFMIVCLIAHEVTTHVDLRLAIRSRRVPAIEQQVHSLLEVLPFTAFLLVAILHWPQALALFGAGTEAADLSIAVAQIPPWRSLMLPGLGLLLLGAVPYGEELVRGIRVAAQQRLSSWPQ